MSVYPTDEFLSDEERFQDMEQQVYDPLPEGLIEQDWLEPPTFEQDWLELPVIEPNWLELPPLEQDWLEVPSLEEIEPGGLTPDLDETMDIDLDI